MSDYMTTNCIRLKTDFSYIDDLLEHIDIEIDKSNFDDSEDMHENLYEINEQLENDNIRIIYYKNNYYVDIILYNDWLDGNDPEFYMSLAEIEKKIKEYEDILKFEPIDIIILAHQWYNGCEEPYT